MSDVANQSANGSAAANLPETRIRESWPSVAAFPAIANLGRMLTGTIVLAPLAWLIMGLAYFGKLLPPLARRYTITNQRVLIRRGLKGKPGPEVRLADLDEVRVVTDANSDFFRAATLELISNGRVALSLPGVPDAESFRHAILNARNAWAPEKAKGAFVPASAK
jgi:hypothetical protein